MTGVMRAFAPRRAVLPAVPTHLARTELAGLLDRATGGVAVVTAPAGYGKTCQVAAWASTENRPVVWVDVEQAHNDPNVFLGAIVDGLAEGAGLDRSVFGSCRFSAKQYASVVAPALERSLSALPLDVVLVIDDVHLIDGGVSGQIIQALVDGIGPESALVLLGRSHPPVRLGRVREQGRLIEVSSGSLALDAAGAELVLDGLGVAVEPTGVELLVADTEGWAVGIRLRGLALRDGDAPTTPVTDRSVTGYVREEWLRGISEDDAQFLIGVSGLEWLSPALCDHVLGRSDSGERLERLAQSHLLVIALDRRDEAYRLHRLLRDVLERAFERSDRATRADVDLRASEWFEHAGDIDRAVHHALRADAFARAESLVDAHAMEMHTAGRYATVRRWVDAFPRSYTLASPSLCIAAGLTSLGFSDGDAAIAWCRFAQSAIAESPDAQPVAALKLATLHSMLTHGSGAASLADAASAYAGLPAGAWHAMAAGTYGTLSFALAADVDSAGLLAEAVSEAELVEATTVQAVALAHLAIVNGHAGDWATFVRLGRSASRLVKDHQLDLMPTLVQVSAVAALAEALDGDFTQAHAEIAMSRRTLGLLNSVSWWGNVQTRIALAHASLLVSDVVAARTYLREAERFVADHPDAIRPRQQIDDLWDRIGKAKGLLPVGPSALTTAELRVLYYLPTNLSLADIAERLYVSRNTAKSHAASVYRKLGVTSRRAAVDAARASGLLATDPHAGTVDGGSSASR